MTIPTFIHHRIASPSQNKALSRSSTLYNPFSASSIFPVSIQYSTKATVLLHTDMAMSWYKEGYDPKTFLPREQALRSSVFSNTRARGLQYVS